MVEAKGRISNGVLLADQIKFDDTVIMTYFARTPMR
jgi:hypothetical protein